jgi:hypothetical protein
MELSLGIDGLGLIAEGSRTEEVEVLASMGNSATEVPFREPLTKSEGIPSSRIDVPFTLNASSRTANSPSGGVKVPFVGNRKYAWSQIEAILE